MFGRGNIIAEPWASYYHLTLMICFDDHRAAHDNDKVRRAMEEKVIEEFLLQVGIDEEFQGFTPVEIIRTVVRELEEKGIYPPGFRS